MALRTVYACQRMFLGTVLSTQGKLIRTDLFTPVFTNIITRGSQTVSALGTNSGQNDLNQAISDAERIVGYPTALQNLRWILNDDIANMAVYLRKVIDGNHPLLQTTKSLLYNGKSSLPIWGLVVLLLSKAVGYKAVPTADQSFGAMNSQRVLAEMTDAIRVAFLIHESMINLQPAMTSTRDSSACDDEFFGNKMSLLTGDYLLALSYKELAALRNQYVIEHMSSAGRDIAESHFIGDRDEQNNPLPARPKPGSPDATVEDDFDFNSVFQKLDVKGAMGNPEREWTVRHLLSTASLLGKACLSSMILAEKSKERQHKGYRFGKHFALAWQTCLDLEPFKVQKIPTDSTFSLVSAPVLFHLHANPKVYEDIEKGKDHIENINFAKLHSAVCEGPGLEKTRQLQRKHIQSALIILDELSKTDAKAALQRILLVMPGL